MKPEQTFAINYIPGSNYFQYLQGDWLLQFDGEKVVHAYEFKKDTLQKHDVKERCPKEYEQRLKSIIQQYMYRMNHNKLVVASPSSSPVVSRKVQMVDKLK